LLLKTLFKSLSIQNPHLLLLYSLIWTYIVPKQAFKLLEADQALLLPRIYCYFDDILGATYGDHNGERLAISEFNASSNMRKSQIYGLKHFVPLPFANNWWVDCFYIAHILDHKLYCNDGLLNGITLKLE